MRVFLSAVIISFFHILTLPGYTTTQYAPEYEVTKRIVYRTCGQQLDLSLITVHHHNFFPLPIYLDRKSLQVKYCSLVESEKLDVGRANGVLIAFYYTMRDLSSSFNLCSDLFNPSVRFYRKDEALNITDFSQSPCECPIYPASLSVFNYLWVAFSAAIQSSPNSGMLQRYCQDRSNRMISDCYVASTLEGCMPGDERRLFYQDRLQALRALLHTYTTLENSITSQVSQLLGSDIRYSKIPYGDRYLCNVIKLCEENNVEGLLAMDKNEMASMFSNFSNLVVMLDLFSQFLNTAIRT